VGLNLVVLVAVVPSLLSFCLWARHDPQGFVISRCFVRPATWCEYSWPIARVPQCAIHVLMEDIHRTELTPYGPRKQTSLSFLYSSLMSLARTLASSNPRNAHCVVNLAPSQALPLLRRSHQQRPNAKGNAFLSLPIVLWQQGGLERWCRARRPSSNHGFGESLGPWAEARG
jgi:hypothetical protein